MKSSRRRGFTLLEMLIATAIMGIAVVGLLSNLSVSLGNASRIAARDRAAVLAQEKLQEVLIDFSFPAGADVQGTFDAALTGGIESGWHARVAVFEAPPEAQPGMAVLERCEVEVWWRDGANRRSLAVNGYRRGTIPLPVAPQ